MRIGTEKRRYDVTTLTSGANKRSAGLFHYKFEPSADQLFSVVDILRYAATGNLGPLAKSEYK
ncbi:MAG: hypothetical protein DMG82_17750 [Acidobacteria bacterium]|nr:MAG: hypothetical protein DMG82_17750 [Acidobacteriota bacterium]